MSVLAVWCNRVSSTRLKDKCASGEPLTVAEHVMARIARAKSVRQIILALPDGPEQRPLAVWGASHGLPIIYGPEHDVVSRFGKAVDRYAQPGDLIFRVMADQPFLDWRAIDFSASVMTANGWDFALPLTFDRDPVYGAGLSPWSMRAWKWIESRSHGEEREHVGMILRRHLKEFEYGLVSLPHWAFRPYRLEMDTSQDILLMNSIWARWRAGGGEGEPSLQEVVALLDRNRDISMLNGMIHEKTGPYTSYTVAEIAAWEKDYINRQVVYPDLPSAIGFIEAKSATCRKCNGPLITVRLGS